MPSILIEVRRQYTREEECALMIAVSSAVHDAFQVPMGEKNVRLLAYEPHRFLHPDSEQPDLYTYITIDAFAGRSLEAKRNLYKAVVKNLEALGIPRDHVEILFREGPRENWGIRGGQAGCDVELGFKIEI